MAKKSTGLASPFLQSKNSGRLLHISDPELYAKIKYEYWGYVCVLKYYAELLYNRDRSSIPKLFVLQVSGDINSFYISLKQYGAWPFATQGEPKDPELRFPEVISVLFDATKREEPLFSVNASNTVFSRTSSVDVRQVLDKLLLKCAARMLSDIDRKNLLRKLAMEKVLNDLNLLSD